MNDYSAPARKSAVKPNHRERRLNGAALPLLVPRRLAVAWRNSFWRPQVLVAGRRSHHRLRRPPFAHRSARFTLHVSRSRKHLLRRIIL